MTLFALPLPFPVMPACLPAHPDHLVNLRLTSKQMVRGSKKCESSEKEAKTKLKKAIEARNTEGARIYAQVGPQGSPFHFLTTTTILTTILVSLNSRFSLTKLSA